MLPAEAPMEPGDEDELSRVLDRLRARLPDLTRQDLAYLLAGMATASDEELERRTGITLSPRDRMIALGWAQALLGRGRP
jgi:hypothetical protein